MRAIGWILAVVGAFLIAAWGASWLILTQAAGWEFPVAFHGLGAGGFLLLGLWLFLDWGSLSALGKDQTVGRAFLSGLLVFVAAGLLIAVNVVGHRYDKRWDLTASKRFSLSDQTLTVTKGLTEKVEILAFFGRGSAEENNFRELLKGYLEASTLIEVNYYDPLSDNLVAEKEGITSLYGTVILRVGDREQRITSGFDEESVTNAIVRATTTTSHTLCAVTGHGEGGADDTGDPAGYGAALGKLTKQNYTVTATPLGSTQPKPEECEVLLLAGPKTDLLPTELDRIAQYVAAGGKAVVMVDPLVTPNLAADLARYGVKVGNDVVIEADPYRQVAQGPSFLVLMDDSFGSHPITEKLTQPAILPLARSVGKGADIAGLTVTELAHSSDQSWGETSLDDLATVPPNPDPGVDQVGRVPVMVAVEVTEPAAIAEASVVGAIPSVDSAPAIAAPPALLEKLEKKAGGKLVVIGDSDFATNQISANGSNLDLLLASIGWMVDDKNQITIHADESKTGAITVGGLPALVVGLIALLGVPGLAVLGAVGTFMSRRQR